MMNKEYEKELEQAKANLADAKERGEDAIGGTWDELRQELFTPEEIAASDLRVAMMIELAKARRERGISQKKLEELSGVKQPVIARMERGYTSPQLDTILKVLAPLGKTLAVVPLEGK
jgi:ribosome-binding protein aMBF1 (putative translation factor)